MSRETSLVTAEWVAQNLNNPSVVIVEVDEDTTLYAQGHIENAITFHWREDLQDGLIRDLISKEKFEALQRTVSQTTPQLFSTEAITTGSLPMHSGTSRSMATQMFAFLMADASVGSSMLAHSLLRFLHVQLLATLQRSAITQSARTATKLLQRLVQRTSSMFAHLLNFQENLQHLLTFHKKADRSRDIFQQRRTFLGQRLQMKMEHLSQMQS